MKLRPQFAYISRRKYSLFFLATLGLTTLLLLLHAHASNNDSTDEANSDRPASLDWDDLYSLSGVDLDRFMRFKERQYSQRRDRVTRVCQELQQQQEQQSEGRPLWGNYSYDCTMQVLPKTFSYDERDKVAYCPITKAGSGTWSRHFINLANPSKEDSAPWRNALQLFAPHLWPLPTDPPLQDLLCSSDMTSLVMVRHPFRRLVSVYFQKLIDLGTKAWAPFNMWLIEEARGAEKVAEMKAMRRMNEDDLDYEFPGDDPIYPTPGEYGRFLVSEMLQLAPVNLTAVDQHFRPQHCACPFCLANFTVYGRLEEMYEDAAYFFLRSGLFERGLVKDVDLAVNPSRSGGGGGGGGTEMEAMFWERVGDDLVRGLYEAFRVDFVMFGYSVREYFESIGMPEKGVSYDEMEAELGSD